MYHLNNSIAGNSIKLVVDFFLYPLYDYCTAKTGYLADMAGPLPPRSQIEITLCWVPGAMLHWPIADEFHNSVPALLSPFLGWVAYIFL